MTAWSNNLSLSKVYTKGLGYIFLTAFLSYYVQFPALSSMGGIEPSNDLFRRAFPSLYYPVGKGYIDSDGLVELINLVGVVASIVIASDIAQHALLYLLITAIYYFLVILGGQFYTFQWDILLIEAGFLTALCFAPWQSRHLTTNDFNVGCWPLRFLLFKLMFMSGIVKIQAECPTWQNLTALEYHFATQCVSTYFRNECTLLRLHHLTKLKRPSFLLILCSFLGHWRGMLINSLLSYCDWALLQRL